MEDKNRKCQKQPLDQVQEFNVHMLQRYRLKKNPDLPITMATRNLWVLLAKAFSR